ncbi:translation initiation factor IF-3 [Flavilitoribacter nigricans]|uniref:Translation initiation factor IF-3 n=1 Tax=Flavilitoribacter nigricans (strain ATCC 23147 / DSM 23189 / NBRC 102662 / NCIMB 1420 / SS-2) TaxID=1122177 RepID=A0A2D0NDM1_FLAN2|nr:translation initiation factor IF-3 [Flavilitoribacter nigricans]PHN06592.1 translation initiation factor IF-3 [Flavilitoribacter nigricans DSM 23189 = NBRC 102662]
MARRYNRNFQRKNDPKDQYRTNEQIRVPEVRLVGDNLGALSDTVGQTIESDIYPTRRVREWAERMGLDVVEIAATAKPPVVRIIDYNKFLYEKKKKEKEIKAKAAKTVVKEIRFGPNTDDHDFEFKLRHARGFLEDGAKVKAYVHFRGRTIVFKDRGELLLLRFLKELEDVGAAEALPKMEGRRMIVIISPKKAKKS